MIKIWKIIVLFIKNFLPLFFAAIPFLSVGGLHAQTISQPLGNATLGAGLATGQTFTATLTGVINRIDVRSRTTGAGTLYLYAGANGSGAIGVVGVPLYTQAVNLTDTGSDAAGFSSMVLSTPFQVTAGTQYSFAVSGFSVSLINTNPYVGGMKLDDFAGVSVNQDISFQIFEAPLAATVTGVPTVSEWGLLGASFLLGMLGVTRLRRRR
jgi:IPTL-CTERM motif